MRKLLVATTLALGALAVGPIGSPATAGGWAVTTLDPLDQAPVAGEPFEVGFTVRQHGHRPVSLPDAAIVVTGGDGSAERFPATPSGPEGHHVAVVEVPEAGSFSWSVEQGGFGPQDLGTLVVSATPSAGAAGDGASPWTAPLFALAAVLAGLGVVDLVRQRRLQPGRQPSPA
jgi:hypothetical protein